MFFFIIFFVVFVVLPKLWLSLSMSRNDKELTKMPFTSEEFGKLILEENNLKEVIIEETS